MPVSSLAGLQTELANLASLPVDGLKAKWTVVIREAPPAGVHRDYLARAVAYRLQEKMFRRLTSRAMCQLQLATASVDVETRVPPPARMVLKPGTRILREWKGEMHEATVLNAGFMYRGRTFRSLSVIAREITGTRWSGPTFFGLNGKLAARKKSGARAQRHPPPSMVEMSPSQANELLSQVANGI